MNEDIIKGRWKEIKGKVQQHWSKLTDDQVGQMQGSYTELEGLLQKHYGLEKDHARKEIDAFIENNKLRE